MSRRNQPAIEFKLSVWAPAGKDLFKTDDPAKLQDAITIRGCSDNDLRRRLGAAYPDLARALAGEVLNKWTVNILDYAITYGETTVLPTPTR